MRIVDAQIHLWGSGLPSNMAHRQVTSFTTEEAVGLMDEGGVDAAVIHPPGWDPNSTAMAFKAVREFPRRFAILGVATGGARKGILYGPAMGHALADLVLGRSTRIALDAFAPGRFAKLRTA